MTDNKSKANQRRVSKAKGNKALDRRMFNKGFPSTLKPFVKGDPRINRSGRPKLIGTASRAILESEFPDKLISPDFKTIITSYTGDDKTKITYAERIAIGQAMKAATGDTQAAREIRSATENKPILQIDMSKLTDEQIERLANGEDPIIVLTASDAGDGGIGEETQEGESEGE